MIQKLKKYIVTTIAVLAFAAPLAAPVAVYAAAAGPGVPTATTDIRNNFCEGTDISVNNNTGNCNTNNANDSVNNAVKLGINIFSAIVGIISVVMIIIGGIRYITSGGDSGKVTSAQNTVLYAVIGLIVVALAQIIVKFVLQRFTQ